MGKKRGGSAKKRGGGAKPGKQHVEVIARSRPLNRKELAEGCAEYCVTPGPDKGQLATVKLDVEAGEDAPGIPGPAGQTQRYHFNVDRAFYEDEDNSDIYAYLGGRVLDRAFGGYHACLLAYGQTGSGKTHTILGDAADPGIIPRLSEEIFARVAESETKTDVIVEMVEIYGKEERMSDLLSDSRWGSDTVLKLRQQDPTSFYVQGTRTYQPADSAQMDAFVQAGVDKRTVAETQMNHQSSRSHSILTISIRQHLGSGTLREGKIRLVDLAGSENLDRSGAEGKQADEAIAINSSLSVLRRVLDALAEKKEHVPFRDSVLTKLLAESLVGNCMTTIITTVSPAKSNAAESKSTLGYGATARKIKTQPVVNDSDEKWKVKELEAEVERLRKAAAAGQVAGGGAGGGMSKADALAMAEEMLAKERDEQESELVRLQSETRERLEKMKATQAKLAAASANQDAEIAQEKAALQEKVSAADERERRLLELEAKLAAREQELEAKETEAQEKAARAAAASTLQAVCRTKIQMDFYAELLPKVKAVRVLQSFVRCWRARRELERRRKAAFYDSARTRRAVVTLQAGWRGHMGRRAAFAWRRERAMEERRRTVSWQKKQVEMRHQMEDLNNGIFTPDSKHTSPQEPQPLADQQSGQPQPQPQQQRRGRRKSSGRNRTPPWLAASPPVPVPEHVEAVVRAKGAELDAKAAKARKRTSRRAPGVALAGDFGRMETMFGNLQAGVGVGGSRPSSNSNTPSTRSSSANSYASSYAASAVDEPPGDYAQPQPQHGGLSESKSLVDLQERFGTVGGLTSHTGSLGDIRQNGKDDVRTRGVSGRRGIGSGGGGGGGDRRTGVSSRGSNGSQGRLSSAGNSTMASSGGFVVGSAQQPVRGDEGGGLRPTHSGSSTGSNGSGQRRGSRARRPGERDRPSALPPMGKQHNEPQPQQQPQQQRRGPAMGRRADGIKAAVGGPSAPSSSAAIETPTKGHANKIFEELFGM